MTAKKRMAGKSTGSALLSAVAGSVSTDSLIEFVERLGVVDLIVGRVKTRIEETDIDELFDETALYLKQNPEVLVVSLGAITVAAGMLVWLSGRRERDGAQRRIVSAPPARKKSRARKEA